MALLEQARKVAQDFDLSDKDVQNITQHFIDQLNDGLKADGTDMSQIPSFVTAVPDGSEKGLYLAVDLGGTNFRVCSIDLHGGSDYELTYEKVAIPKELMVAKTAKELFSFLALQIEKFLKKHHSDRFAASVRRRQTVSTPEGYRDEHIFRLGFTFSFPVQQTGINKGTLIRWTKGFDIADAVGKDICQLLQVEIDALKLPVRVAALVNDTVGTLMARAYKSPGKAKTLLGAIFGTGTNGAYIEKLSKITKDINGDVDRTTGDMIVNTEWGSFDNSLKVLRQTKYDKQLDEESVNPGFQVFEKLVSGMFLGEILRRVIVDLSKEAGLFKHSRSSENDLHASTVIHATSPLHTAWAVDSNIVSSANIPNDGDGLNILRRDISNFLGVHAASLEDARAIKIVANAIARRAARLAGAAIAGVVIATGHLKAPTVEPASKIAEDLKAGDIKAAAETTASKIADTVGLKEEDLIDIGVDGSLVEFYPGFEDLIREALRAVLGAAGERRIQIGIAKDGSGVGAALIALVADKLEKKGRRDYVENLGAHLDNVKLATDGTATR